MSLKEDAQSFAIGTAVTTTTAAAALALKATETDGIIVGLAGVFLFAASTIITNSTKNPDACLSGIGLSSAIGIGVIAYGASSDAPKAPLVPANDRPAIEQKVSVVPSTQNLHASLAKYGCGIG
jgi:hypothetical protein